MAAKTESHADKMAQTMGEVLQIGRVVYQTLRDGRVPEGEEVLPLRGKRWSLTLRHKPTRLVLTEIK